MANEFFTQYLNYTGHSESLSEVPAVFHRWSMLGTIGALVERNIYLPFGNHIIYPNQYMMLLGESGTKKSTAIKLAKKLTKLAGYKTFAVEKTSMQKFLADLHKETESDSDPVEFNLFGSKDREGDGDGLVTNCFVCADEANDFFGIGNGDFLSVLGTLWDYEGVYENRIKTGRSDWIPNPNISILSGNTATNFSLAFPTSILSQGFFSRLLLIYGEPNGRRVTIPKTPSAGETAEIVSSLSRIRNFTVGEIGYTESAYRLLDKIYQTYVPLADSRFESYTNRRSIHLLKLCLVVAASKLESPLSESTVQEANTYLTYVESLMPKALGEFGKSKASDINHKIVQFVEGAGRPVQMNEIFKVISSDIEKASDMQGLLQKLFMAEKLQATKMGILPMRKAMDIEKSEREGLTCFAKFLTTEELEIKR